MKLLSLRPPDARLADETPLAAHQSHKLTDETALAVPISHKTIGRDSSRCAHQLQDPPTRLLSLRPPVARPTGEAPIAAPTSHKASGRNSSCCVDPPHEQQAQLLLLRPAVARLADETLLAAPTYPVLRNETPLATLTSPMGNRRDSSRCAHQSHTQQTRLLSLRPPVA